MPASKTIRVRIVRNGSICYIPLAFDPREVFGKLRAPVKPETRARRISGAVRAIRARPERKKRS